NVNTTSGPEGVSDRLTLVAGQWLSTLGVQRNYPTVDTRILYSGVTDTDFTAPVVSSTTAVAGNGAATFDVTTDGTAQHVFVLSLDGSAWRNLELTNVGGTWAGTTPISGTTVDYFVQAVDGSGNVGVSSNKATLFATQPRPTPPPNTTPTV